MIHDEVLLMLEENRGEIVTGGKLARNLKVSRNTIWKHISKLKTEGHEITSIPNKGYILEQTSDGLSKTLIERKLSTSFIGRNLRVISTVDSTNSFIKSLPSGQKFEGLVVVANEQTAGIGRCGREFLSPVANGIYMSVLVKPHIPLERIQLLTLCAALSVIRAIENTCSLEPGVKWVNDVLIKDKKVCGILTEATISAELKTIEYAIVGIGINTKKVPEQLEFIATSLEEVSHEKVSRNILAAAVINEFEKQYLQLEREKIDHILNEYRGYLNIVGKKVKVLSLSSHPEIKVQGIDATGALVGVDSIGFEHHVSTGEIEIVSEEK